jgi:hypothetical protein
MRDKTKEENSDKNKKGESVSDIVYFIAPSPSGDFLLELTQELTKQGYNLSSSAKEIFVACEVKQILLDKGSTTILSNQFLNEEVLPDNKPRNFVLDTLKYKLNRCSPTHSLHVIDSYLYPSCPDSNYVSDFIDVFEDTLKRCSSVVIVTLKDRNKKLEQEIQNEIKKVNPKVSIKSNYTNAFHDRFWIIDNLRGLFVGSSLNGIGKRYSIVDYLSEDDAKEIINRCNSL